MPVGLNSLYNFMSRISAEAKLSKRYTNHCLRAEVASTLHSAGVSSKAIMSVTRHRNVQSLTSYVKLSHAEKRKITSILASNHSSTDVSIAVSEQAKACQGLVPSASSSITPPTVSPSSARLDLDHTLHFFTGAISGGNFSVNIYQKS